MSPSRPTRVSRWLRGVCVAIAVSGLSLPAAAAHHEEAAEAAAGASAAATAGASAQPSAAPQMPAQPPPPPKRARPLAPINPDDLAKRIEGGDAPVVLDVRSQTEFDEGHIPGARLVPHEQLAERLESLGIPKDSEVVVHCERGGRATVAQQVLLDNGYQKVRALSGHMRRWRGTDKPVVTKADEAAKAADEETPASEE